MTHVTSRPNNRRRVFLYGCGIVAPGAASLDQFLEDIWNQRVNLVPEPALNNAFLVGKPKFQFEKYRDWISSRFAPARFTQISDKGGENVYMAVGATIDALTTQPSLEDALKKLDPGVSLCMGSGLGDLPVIFSQGKNWDRTCWAWNHFWADPERNAECAGWRKGAREIEGVPTDPLEQPADSLARVDAWARWDEFWANRSSLLKDYVREFIDIEGGTVGADVAADKLKLIRAKAKAGKQLQEKYGCPTPPWEAVNPTLLWNLPNAPAAQISMLLNLHGSSWNSNGACATFGLLLHEALKDIHTGRSEAAIVGTVDNTPPPEVVSAFFGARVLATGTNVSTPLSEMRGTHVAGGACVWIIGTEELAKQFNIPHMGVEILSAEISSDAEHIITPSKDGPKLAIRRALESAHISPADIGSWDLHATGTPGDASELTLIEDFVPATAVVSARKGLFGHGMASNGGWELTAQVLGPKYKDGMFHIPPCGIDPDRIHSSISSMKRIFATNKPVEVVGTEQGLVCGKLSMGVGGISSCVITRVQKK
jgi:3-oxoacyl-[acyl-carrier-protein] synthase II